MKTIRIIHSNDLHSKYEQFLKMAHIIKEKKTLNSIILDSGDFNDFSNSITYGSEGIGGLELLHSLNYTALTIGNNEGFQPLEIIEKNASANLVAILSCNLLKLDNQEILGVKPYIIKMIDNIRFLIIGVSPYHFSYNQYYYHYGIQGIDPIHIIQKIILKEKGNYDICILLSHLGLKAEIKLTQIFPQIHLILSGHSHHQLPCIKVNQTLIHQSGVRGSHIGIIDLNISQNQIISFQGENIPIIESMQDDLPTKQLYEKIIQKANLKLNKPICEIPKNLVFYKTKECNLTNLLADYLFQNYSCDLALINSGLTEKNLNKGFISMNDIIHTSNSPLNIATMEVKGKYIIASLMQSLHKNFCLNSKSHPGYRGQFLGFLHVSYNCSIKIIYNKLNIYCNKQLIEEDKWYKIVTTDYFLRGMGYQLLVHNKNGVIHKETLKEALLNALKDKNAYLYNDIKRWEI